MSAAPVRSRISAGLPSAMIAPVAHQQQPVAALGLVHHVARHQHGRARVGEPVEERPQVPAQHRVEADGRLVEHQQVGFLEQRHRQADPADRCPPDSRPTTWSRCPARSTAATARSTSVGADAEHLRRRSGGSRRR